MGAAFAALALVLASAVSSAAAPAEGGIERKPLPSWVERYPLPAAKRTRTSDGLRYLLVDDQTNLTGPVPVWVRTMAYEIVAETGLSEAGRFTLSYQPLHQTVQLHAVEVLRDGEVLDRLDAVAIEVLRRESDLETAMLDGRLTVHATLADLRVGDRVRYRYSVRGENPVFGHDHYSRYSGSYGVGLAERRVRYVYPEALPLRWRVTGQPYAERRGRIGEARTFSLVASPVPRTPEQDGTPDWYDPTGTIEVTTAPDWAGVAGWGAALYPRRFDERAVATELAMALRLDRADPSGSLQRAVAFVQGEIRYMAVDLGANSHVPFPPSVIVERRFGDCKDKSALLVTLLAEAGIDAEPVLVNTASRATVRDWLPSAAAFDHVVVRAHLPDGDIWVDATRNRERGPFAQRAPLEFGVGLPLKAGAGLVEIPAPVPAVPSIEVVERIRLAQDGARTAAHIGVVTTYRQGESEDIRRQFDDDESSEIGERYLGYMRGFHADIDASGEPAGQDVGDDAFRTTEQYSLALDAGEDVFDIVLFQLSDWLDTPDAQPRRDPRSLDGPRHATQTIRVDGDGGWSISPEREQVENPYFRFVRDVRVEGDDLVIRGMWTRFADLVPAADDARYRADVAEARELLYFGVDLDGSSITESLGTPAQRAWPLAAITACVLLLVAGYRRRHRAIDGGVLFRPWQTGSAVYAAPLSWTWPIACLVLATLLEVALDAGAEYVATGARDDLMAVGGALLRSPLQVGLWALLMSWTLRALGVRAGYARLLHACCLALVPVILFESVALLSVGGRLERLSEAHVGAPGEVAGLAVAGGLILGGAAWTAVANVNMVAAAAATSRSRVLVAFAAWVALAAAAALLIFAKQP